MRHFLLEFISRIEENCRTIQFPCKSFTWNPSGCFPISNTAACTHFTTHHTQFESIRVRIRRKKHYFIRLCALLRSLKHFFYCVHIGRRKKGENFYWTGERLRLFGEDSSHPYCVWRRWSNKDYYLIFWDNLRTASLGFFGNLHQYLIDSWWKV